MRISTALLKEQTEFDSNDFVDAATTNTTTIRAVVFVVAYLRVQYSEYTIQVLNGRMESTVDIVNFFTSSFKSNLESNLTVICKR